MTFQLFLLIMFAVKSDCQYMGEEFILVFPENIASFHPLSPHNKLRITALHNATKVDVLPQDTGSEDSVNLKSGEIHEIGIKAEMELDKKEISTAKVVTITSTNDITLEILSHRDKSIQTALLFPTNQLDKEYRIPPIPRIHKTTHPEDQVNNLVTERSRFKLIIATKDQNQIEVNGQSYVLYPGQVRQIWVENKMVGTPIIGLKPFLVLFSHPCAIQFNCTCGVLYTPLQPSSSSTPSRFIVPPVFSEGAQGQTYLLKPSDPDNMDFSVGSSEVSGSLVLQRPGMLMNMIPEKEFGSCFAIHTVQNASENWAIIVAPADSTGGVQIGNNPASDDWKLVSEDSKYKYAKVSLNEKKNIIWNKSDRMAVWFVGKTHDDENAWFGHPAARLSVNADFRGCVVKPDKIEVLPPMSSWKESIQACRDKDMSLITLTDRNFQKKVYKRLLDQDQAQADLWMGMRKSSYLGKWYWYNDDPLEYTDWYQGSPSSDDEARCAQISLKDPKKPGWINQHCCNKGKPVCYQPPELLTIRPSS